MRSIIEKRPVHIVTIEDPIEFLFADGKAAVSQREVSTDSPSFDEALKNMFRQDPDVIMVGEMRDWGTMQTAITAAETGHLVFSTLHTNSAAQSIDRIIDSCPQEQQAQVRSQLSIVLRAIVSMNLIETSDGSGRCAVVEVMINSPKIEKHILSGEVKEIHEEIENSVNYYKMQSMNQSLIALLVNKRITYPKAMELSTDPEDLSLKLRKLFPQIEENQRGGLMASDNDFSQITQLIEIKRLYEEQEEKWKLRLSEKDEELNKYMMELRDQRKVIEGRDQVLTDVEGENNRLKADNERVSREFQQKIAQLNERIKELNQRLVLAEGGGRRPRPDRAAAASSRSSPDGRRRRRPARRRLRAARIRACAGSPPSWFWPASAPILTRRPPGRRPGPPGGRGSCSKSESYTKAEEALREILAAAPGNARAHGNLALALLSQGKTREAIDEGRLAAAFAPETPEARYIYALTLKAAGRTRWRPPGSWKRPSRLKPGQAGPPARPGGRLRARPATIEPSRSTRS